MATTEQKKKGNNAANSTDNTAKGGGNNFKVPDWLTADKFENVLKENVAGYRKISNFKAYPALKPGENYATLMLRVEIEVKIESEGAEKVKLVSYMLKVPIDNPVIKEMMTIHNLFDIEKGMYMDVVPEMERMLHDVGVEIKFGPKWFVLSKDDDCILLEDLRTPGFRNADRLKGLDMEHTKKVLTKLAQWHAASATRVETKGRYPDSYCNGFFKEQNREMVEEVFESFVQPFTKCLKTYAGHEEYEESVLKLQSNVVDMIMSMSKNDPNEFNVLNHGDLWSNNVMFQYDEAGNIKETYLVDYQIPKYGTPAQDLYYFLLSSTSYDIKLKHFDYFVRFYHGQLQKHLCLLKYPKRMPALKDIHMQLVKYGCWGYHSVTGIMAAVLLDPHEKANLNNFISNDAEGIDLKMMMFSNPRYRKHAEAIFPWLQNRGGLEYCS